MRASESYEARLVRRFREGDPRAMDVLFDLYADRVMGVAVRLTDTREDAEEVAQEAFLRAFRHARELRGDAAGGSAGDGFGPWIFAITRNLCADKRRQLRLPTLSLSSMEIGGYSSGAESLHEEVALRAQRAALLSALDRMPEDWRTVITLCDLEDISHAEAAIVLDRSVSATKSMLYRARRALRDHFAREWGDT